MLVDLTADLPVLPLCQTITMVVKLETLLQTDSIFFLVSANCRYKSVVHMLVNCTVKVVLYRVFQEESVIFWRRCLRLSYIDIGPVLKIFIWPLCLKRLLYTALMEHDVYKSSGTC